MPLERDLGEVCNHLQDAILEDIRKIAVGWVTAVKGQFVDVQLATSVPLFDESTGTTFESPLALGSIPFCSIKAGGFIVWVPPAVNDTVLVCFTDLSYDTWRQSNGNTVVNPNWTGRHTGDSAFAIPVCAPDTKPIASADAGKLVIGKDGSSALIKISGSEIDLGNPASDAVALASKVATELANIATALTHIVVSVPITGPAGVTAGTGTATYTPGSVASTLVKCG